jgi:hypothetical protein
MIGSALLFVVAWWQRDALPAPDALAQSVLAEPEQRPTDRAAFQTTVGGITYTVRPLFTYDLAGLVVSKHDADAWWDWIHAASNDKLNVTDLCVVWGANAESGVYRKIDFSSGEFVCYYAWSASEVGAVFDPASLSNNHLLSDDPAIARVLKGARVGDQVHFRGYLAEYTHDHGFHFFRGTSVTRTDQGNGACETVFATDAEVLERGNVIWRNLFWLSPCIFAAALVAWFALPFRAAR